jgi:hypothetical protein
MKKFFVLLFNNINFFLSLCVNYYQVDEKYWIWIKTVRYIKLKKIKSF